MLTCACALVCGGCFAKKRPAVSLGAVTLAHPVVPRAGDIAPADAPEISVAMDPVPRLVVPHGAPARPHVTPAQAPERLAAGKPEEPLIAPELSDEELSAAKSATQQSLSATERNLNMTKGKALNAAQQDLVSKIVGFVDSAREAIKNNDWQRARNQARKAEVLSEAFAPRP